MSRVAKQGWLNISALLASAVLVAGCAADGTNATAGSSSAGSAAAGQLTSAEEAGWELWFEDNFERDELGDNWQVVDGSWEVEDGHLRGSGTLISAVGFPNEFPPGFQRLEFTAATDVKPLGFLAIGDAEPEISVSDTSSFIHAQSPEDADGVTWRTGYFFQFGGYHNTQNRIRKQGNDIIDDTDPDVLIKPDEEHHIVVENDEGHLRFYVDGELIMDYEERMSIMSEDHNRVGFYFYTAAKVDDVKVYVKRLPDGLDTDLD